MLILGPFEDWYLFRVGHFEDYSLTAGMVLAHPAHLRKQLSDWLKILKNAKNQAMLAENLPLVSLIAQIFYSNSLNTFLSFPKHLNHAASKLPISALSTFG